MRDTHEREIIGKMIIRVLSMAANLTLSLIISLECFFLSFVLLQNFISRKAKPYGTCTDATIRNYPRNAYEEVYGVHYTSKVGFTLQNLYCNIICSTGYISNIKYILPFKYI